MNSRRRILIFWTILLMVLVSRSGFAQRSMTSKKKAPVDQPAVQFYSSKNFQLMTDLSPSESKDLLIRLESMTRLVSEYFGSPLRKPIRMYVIRDFHNWPAEELQKMSPDGIEMVRQGGGLTKTRVQGIVGGPKVDSDAIVFATADHGTPQHEAIHAYCGLTFGELGPTWYSEGMAEVGQYWKENEKGVNANPAVIEYLKSQEPKPLMQIVDNPLETTGDSWQNYAWRWVICHMLGMNENYSARFKPLGMSFLTGGNSTFQTVYGAQLPEIEFEYRLFLQDLEQGYRCDLCSWDWKTQFKVVQEKPGSLAKIQSKAGWQASRGIVSAGKEYKVATTGTWKLSKEGEALTAAGETSGNGRLIGIIFQDYALGEPFEIGDSGSFTAPSDGKLFLRCREAWGQIADNQGAMTVRITAAD